MSVPKTKPTEVSVDSHIAAIANEEQRNDTRRLVVLMRKVTKQNQGCGGQASLDSGATLTQAVTKATPLSLRSYFRKQSPKAGRHATPSTTLWFQLKPRSDRVGTAGRPGNSVNAVNDRIAVRRKLVTALAQYQGPAAFLFSGK